MGIEKTLDRIAAWAACGLHLPVLGAAQAAAAITGVLRTMKPESEATARASNVAIAYSKALQTSMGLLLKHGVYGAQVSRVARAANFRLAAELAGAFVSTPGAKAADIAVFVESMVSIANETLEAELQSNVRLRDVSIAVAGGSKGGNPMHTINWHED